MAAESRHVEVVFDDLIGFLETGFDIAPVVACNGNVALASRIIPDDRSIGLSSFAYVHDVRPNFPLRIESLQCLRHRASSVSATTITATSSSSISATWST